MVSLKHQAPSYSALDGHVAPSLEELDCEGEYPSSRETFKIQYTGWPTRILMAGTLLLLLVASFKLGQQSQDGNPSTTSVFELLSQPRFDTSELGLRPNNLFPRPLGKKVLLLDVDTRPWEMNASLADQPQLAWGRMNHYLYAKLHNYDYRYIQSPQLPDSLHPTWVKIIELNRLLSDPSNPYQFIVFTDSDVMFPHLNLPLEHLFSHWNITPSIALAGALDPPGTRNTDDKGNTNINTGFMVLQTGDTATRMLRDWLECPTDVKYPRCSKWKTTRYHEQSAFSNFLRYDYAEHVREIGCAEANGIPRGGRGGGHGRGNGTKHAGGKGHGKNDSDGGGRGSGLGDHRKGSGRVKQQGHGAGFGKVHKGVGDVPQQRCEGKFVRHYWVDKNALKGAVRGSIADVFMPGVFESLMDDWHNGRVVEDRSDMVDEGRAVLDHRW